MNEYKELNYKLVTLLYTYDNALISEGVNNNIAYQKDLEKQIKETREKIDLLLNKK